MIETDDSTSSEVQNKIERGRFKVVKPSRNDWLTIAIICFGFYVSWFFLIQYMAPPRDAISLIIILISVSIISVVTSLFLWKYLGKWTLKKIVVNTLRDHKEYNDILIFKKDEQTDKKEKKYSFTRRLISILFGINLGDRVLYYIEENAYIANISNIRYLIKNKMIDLLAACLGVAFLVATFARLFIDNIEVGILVSSITILASPILASWILPIIWTLRDARIKFLTPKMNNFELSQKVRRSILSRFLGFTGLFAGIGFLFNVWIDVRFREKTLSFRETILVFLLAILTLIIIIILLAGTASLVAVLYLTLFHEKIVNDIRAEISKFLPKGVTNVMFTKSSFV